MLTCMGNLACGVCHKPTRKLEEASNNAEVDYYHCSRCGQVWTTMKDGTTLLDVAVPKRVPPRALRG